MSTLISSTAEVEVQPQAAETPATTQAVICLGPWYEDATADHLTSLLEVLRDALGEHAAQSLITYPASDAQASAWQHAGMVLQPYQPTARLHPLPVQSAATYLSMYEVMRAHNASCGLLLGMEAHTLQPTAIRGLLAAVLERNADVALPRYTTGPNDALINASILHPLTRAIFGMKASFPMAIDVALSNRMAERMATAAQRLTASSQLEALLWPASEAAIAGFVVEEVIVGMRDLPHPVGTDISTILGTLGTSLFADIEAKASFWQRTRPPMTVAVTEGASGVLPATEPVSAEEISELIESFRIGYGNLHEIWSLVLPPQTLLGLKRLSRLPSEEFALPDALWVRIVYDYALAHRLRTINRGHLMGSLTPLYLAWVASHILAGQQTGNGSPEALARAFEADKPYLVSRWRWPDRFNP